MEFRASSEASCSLPAVRPCRACSTPEPERLQPTRLRNFDTVTGGKESLGKAALFLTLQSLGTLRTRVGYQDLALEGN